MDNDILGILFMFFTLMITFLRPVTYIKKPKMKSGLEILKEVYLGRTKGGLREDDN